MSARCPSDLALEIFLMAPERAPAAPHVAGCPACAGRLAKMREQGETFRRVVFPQTVAAVERALEHRWTGWTSWFRRPLFLAPVGALAAALVAFLVVQGELHDDYEYGSKGNGVTLAVFANGHEGSCAVQEGQKVRADSTLWFKVQPAAGCWLWVLSVDASGEISRLYPPKGAKPELRGEGLVPVGAALDGKPGLERVYAVCAPSAETPWSEVRASAAAAADGPERLRTTTTLGGSLSRAFQASVLIEKEQKGP